MKKTLFKHKILLITTIIIALFLTITTIISVDYTLIAPGYNNNVADTIVIEDGFEETGSFSTTSVIVEYKMTLLQKWMSNYINTVTTYESPDYYNQTSTSDLRFRSLVLKDDSLAKSLIVAYEAANIPIEYKTNMVVSLLYDFTDENTVELGDYVLSIDGINPLTDDIKTYDCGDTAVFTVLRDGEELSFTLQTHSDGDTCRFGVSMRSVTSITNAGRNYTINDTNTGGPSGGLMQSLYVLNELTDTDLTHGLNIAGTGTITLSGNVGSIGGIEEKIITSALNGIDVFFVPHLSDSEDDNYIRALKTIETLNTDMVLVPVSTLDDALTYLEGLGE